MPAPVMLGMDLPESGIWSPRVTVALGQNPGVFTGPGTNSYLVGTGEARLLLDPGQGEPAYLPVLQRAMERCGCRAIQEIILTHGHPDHIGGVRSVLQHFGPAPVRKMLHARFDADYADLQLRPLQDGARIETEGAALRAIHAPGHAPDHLCFMLEEERALFSGDNVLGVGTTVIPAHENEGDLSAYLHSLEVLLAEAPGRIYPAHGPLIEDGAAKLRDYIAHRNQREQQVLAELRKGPRGVMEMVREIYAAYPEKLHAAAAQSVGQHLRKLAGEGRAQRAANGNSEAGGDPLGAIWSLPDGSLPGGRLPGGAQP